jgi:prepilin signal peptidase PulO-like enzyme (type II secretory pathway)
LAGSPALALAYGVLLAGLVIASAIDFKYFIIPDQISIWPVWQSDYWHRALFRHCRSKRECLLGALQSLLGIGPRRAGVMYLISRAGQARV